MTATMTGAFAGLLDDAAVFPPGNALVPAAIRAHIGHHAAWYADLVGPFVFPHAGLGHDFAGCLAGRPLDMAVTASRNLPGVLAAAELDGVRVVAVELAPAKEFDAESLVATFDSALPDDVLGYLEVPRGPRLETVLDGLAGTRYRAKFRTGGTVSAAHPSEAELAATLLAAVSRGIRFKCTAGLHHAVRHTDGDLEQHGFLNVLLATDAALAGAGAGELTALLGERSPDTVASLVAKLGPDRIAAAREWFLSFGTCSIDDPLAELIALGLLAAPAEVDQR
jgi:hypothetical protein